MPYVPTSEFVPLILMRVPFFTCLRALRAFIFNVPYVPSFFYVPYVPSSVKVPYLPSSFYVPYAPSFFYVPYVPSSVNVPYLPSSFYVPYAPSFFLRAFTFLIKFGTNHNQAQQVGTSNNEEE